jgi:spermidine synthase
MREFLNVFHGNELVFGIILANWMALLGIGAYLGKFGKKIKNKINVFIYSQITIAFLPFLLIFLIRSLRTFVLLPGVMPDLFQIFFSTLLILAPYCLLSGFLLTLACSVFSPKRNEKQIGMVYFIDNIGDILGGVLFSFVFVFLLNHFQASYVVMLMNLFAAFLLSNFTKNKSLKGFVFLLIICSFSFFLFDFDKETTKLMFPNQELIEYKSSIYGKVVITKIGEQLNFFENGLPLFSTENTIANEEVVHYAMVQHENPKHVLLISGGVAGTIDEILKYNVESIDYVELDPSVIELGKKYTDNLDREKLNIIRGDAHFFIKNSKKKYDVIIIDLPDPSTAQVNRFYTIEFFKELKNILNDDGVVSLSLSSSINYLNLETIKLNSVIYNTLSKEFKNVIVIPGDENFFIASDSNLTYNISARIKEKGIKTLYVNENYLSGKLSKDRIDYVINSIREEKVEVNHDFTPVAYYYHILYWLSHFEINIIPFLVILLALIILSLLKMDAFSFSISTTGFTASSLEVALLLAFQVLYGYVYYNIGIIISAFMIGLAVGAYKMNKWLERKAKKDFVRLEFLIFFYSILLPLIIIFLSSLKNTEIIMLASQTLFPLLTFTIALLVGMEFPLASKLHLKGKDIEGTASLLYASDLIGACLGALLSSALLIPLLGLINVCFLVGALNLVSGLVVWKKR